MNSILKFWVNFLIFIFIQLTATAAPLDKDLQSNNSNFPFIIMALILGMIIGVICTYLYSKAKVYSILRAEKNLYLKSLKNSGQKNPFNYIGLISELKKSKDEKKEELAVADSKIDDLKKELKQLKLENAKSENKPEDIQSELPEDSDTISKPIDLGIETNGISSTDIYFTIPERDGSFNTINSKRNKEVDSFYKIVPDHSKQKGKVLFISGDFDLRALDNIDHYLNPVCEIENIGNRITARKIEMTKSGTVVLNGDSWKIDINNKVKIRLI